MLYLNKLLKCIKKNPLIFKSQEIILELGLSSTQIKDLKKFALEKEFIISKKEGVFLSNNGEQYLAENPTKVWATQEFSLRPDINLEYLKDEKTPAILTKAIRNLAKYFLENLPLKENSLEKALFEDLKNCKELFSQIEKDILNNKRIFLDSIFEKYIKLGLTKSIISIAILKILADNLEEIAIYEKSQFQLYFNPLMFDRMIACPQNFEIQRTVMNDRYILKDISKIILNKKSNNILEITKGLYTIIKGLDKYTMNTQNLNNKTLRFRNTIVNAKDPISLFERDIPKVLNSTNLSDCDREFLNSLKISLSELKNCTSSLINDLKSFIFKSFHTKSKENLSERFLNVKEFIGETDLKVLLNCIIDINIPEELWINRVATFINKYRVPKDWTDEDLANFKLKTKELAFKFSIIESTVGTNISIESKDCKNILNEFKKLSEIDKAVFLRNAVNI